tara:strand:+ start:1355 stop:1537 length:183 start_codon:yes stop_codon:yes gene_type:complete
MIRGGNSTVPTADTLAQIKAVHSGTTSLEIADAGHAPARVADDQIEAIRDWLGSAGQGDR